MKEEIIVQNSISWIHSNSNLEGPFGPIGPDFSNICGYQKVCELQEPYQLQEQDIFQNSYEAMNYSPFREPEGQTGPRGYSSSESQAFYEAMNYSPFQRPEGHTGPRGYSSCESQNPYETMNYSPFQVPGGETGPPGGPYNSESQVPYEIYNYFPFQVPGPEGSTGNCGRTGDCGHREKYSTENFPEGMKLSDSLKTVFLLNFNKILSFRFREEININEIALAS